eukprot:1315989-Amorphochlora_amoeboformis.AAC.2
MYRTVQIWDVVGLHVVARLGKSLEVHSTVRDVCLFGGNSGERFVLVGKANGELSVFEPVGI